MARQTRQQRRARRAEAAADGGATERPRGAQTPVRPATQPPADAGARAVPGAGGRRFVGESWAELKKVEWPRRPRVIQATALVLIACAIVGAFLFAADLVFERVVEYII